MKRDLIPPRRLVTTILVLVGSLVAGLAPLSCAAPLGTLTSVTIGVPALEQNALLYVAESRQLFESNGLQVTIQIYETGVETASALLDGNVDRTAESTIPDTSEFLYLDGLGTVKPDAVSIIR